MRVLFVLCFILSEIIPVVKIVLVVEIVVEELVLLEDRFGSIETKIV